MQNVRIMEEKLVFTTKEKDELKKVAARLRESVIDSLLPDDESKVMSFLESEIRGEHIKRDVFGLNPILLSFQTAELEVEEIGMKRDCVLAILLYNSVTEGTNF